MSGKDLGAVRVRVAALQEAAEVIDDVQCDAASVFVAGERQLQANESHSNERLHGSGVWRETGSGTCWAVARAAGIRVDAC